MLLDLRIAPGFILTFRVENLNIASNQRLIAGGITSVRIITASGNSIISGGHIRHGVYRLRLAQPIGSNYRTYQ